MFGIQYFIALMKLGSCLSLFSNSMSPRVSPLPLCKLIPRLFKSLSDVSFLTLSKFFGFRQYKTEMKYCKAGTSESSRPNPGLLLEFRILSKRVEIILSCLLYTSDAADE